MSPVLPLLLVLRVTSCLIYISKKIFFFQGCDFPWNNFSFHFFCLFFFSSFKYFFTSSFPTCGFTSRLSISFYFSIYWFLACSIFIFSCHWAYSIFHPFWHWSYYYNWDCSCSWSHSSNCYYSTCNSSFFCSNSFCRWCKTYISFHYWFCRTWH